MKPKPTHGGQRSGSGRKKADYQTTTISFRVRVEMAGEVKRMVKDYILSNKKSL